MQMYILPDSDLWSCTIQGRNYLVVQKELRKEMTSVDDVNIRKWCTLPSTNHPDVSEYNASERKYIIENATHSKG